MKQSILLFSLCFGLAVQAQNNFKYLDINNVKAGIGNRGIMHWDQVTGAATYEVPAGSGKHVGFATALWIGGYDNGNQLHLAAQTYRQGGDDFWPGPLDTTNAAITPATSFQYDKIWKLNRTDIDAFITNFNSGNVQNGSYTPVADLLSWPAQGTGAQSKNLAPFRDVNNNHVYDPLTGGDYPIIKGDQSLYYIFNDNLNHGNTGGAPLKVEVHATAYAYGNSATASQYGFLSNATFYNYKIINRSNQSYNNAFVTLWTDADLGYYGDDYIGCDVQGNYGYMYNADAFDETIGQVNGYGNNIPAAGFQVLKGGVNSANGIDDDNDGAIDESCERMGMTRFNYYNNSFPGTPIQQSDPSNAQEYYRYMSGYWRDGTPFTCGGNAYGGTVSTPFVYPGVSDPNSPCGPTWTEATAGNTPNDRRHMIGTGPFPISAGGTYEIEYVHCTSFPTGSSTALAKLKTDMQMLKTFNELYYPNACTQVVSFKEENRLEGFSMYPNPAASEINLSFTNKTHALVEVRDVYGKLLLTATYEGDETMPLNVSALASGIYFVKISSEGRSAVQKFIKQ